MVNKNSRGSMLIKQTTRRCRWSRSDDGQKVRRCVSDVVDGSLPWRGDCLWGTGRRTGTTTRGLILGVEAKGRSWEVCAAPRGQDTDAEREDANGGGKPSSSCDTMGKGKERKRKSLGKGRFQKGLRMGGEGQVPGFMIIRAGLSARALLGRVVGWSCRGKRPEQTHVCRGPGQLCAVARGWTDWGGG
jgi:hypothetical protein